MRAFALDAASVTAGNAVGAVLCHDVVAAGPEGRVKLGKGRILGPADVAALRLQAGEIHLIAMDPGDIHEDEASQRLARAIRGQGLAVTETVESQTHLRADRRGILEVRADALEAMNALPDISVFTLYHGQPVDRGKAVAAAKVTPLVVPEVVVAEAEAIARDAQPVVQVRPFCGGAVGVLVRERLAGKGRDTFEAAIRVKLGWFGSAVAGISYLPDDVEAIAAALEAFMGAGVSLILAAGVNSTDPLDLTLQALARVGARTERRGVPAHPGSTCWLAYIDQVPVFGLALCGMFSHTTVLDLLLPRFLSGQNVQSADLALLGHGGLLNKEMSFRFPRYRDDL